MSGTIRCKHGHVLTEIGRTEEVICLETEADDCSVELPLEVYENIQQGANFTHVFFTVKEAMDKYLKDHAERFQFVSHASAQLKPGSYWHLIF
jgi:hypothetical protein